MSPKKTWSRRLGVLARHASTGQLLFTLGLLLFGVGYLVLAWPLDVWSGHGRPGPGMIPLFAGIGLLTSALYLLTKQLRGKAEVKVAAGSTGTTIERGDQRTAFIAALLAALYIVLMPLIGIWEVTVLYCVTSAIQLNASGRVKAAIATLAVPVAVLAVFDFVFDLPFPQGIVFS